MTAPVIISAVADTPARVLDALLLLAAASVLVLLRTSRPCSARWRRVLTLLAVIAVLLQVEIEGYRWQLAPAYAFIGALVVVNIFLPGRSVLTRWFDGWTGWTLVILAAVLTTVIPNCEEPKPTGPYAVGTVVRHLVDTNRLESLADIHGPRELMIQIWYPAERTNTRNSTIPSCAAASQSASTFELFSQTCRRYATVGAPISAARASYPVVIYSPSWHGQRDQNTFQTEELASHGFVVVGIDHPYSSRVTAFPDGRIAHAVLVPFLVFSSNAALLTSIRYIERQLSVRVEDVEFTVRELRRFDQHGSRDPFSGHLDLNRLGIVGYSFGGAVAAQACFVDPHFKAGMNMNGWLFGDVAEAGISQPFLFMDQSLQSPSRSQLSGRAPEKRREARMEERDYRQERHSVEAHGGYLIAIDGTRHVNFETPPTAATLRYCLFDSGRIDAQRAMTIIRVYTLAFFEKHLNGAEEPILTGSSSKFPEVHFAWRANHAPQGIASPGGVRDSYSRSNLLTTETP